MKTYKLNEFASKIGVCVSTLQKWDRKGILIASRTLTNRRYYTEEQLQKCLKQTQNERYINELRGRCGDGYSIKTIDCERCIYKNLGNGYDIEISCVSKRWERVSIYVWKKDSDGHYRVVETAHDVLHSDIPGTLRRLERRYSNG